MKILIVGTGAVGGYYGALLARAGHDVTFVARGEHGRAIADRGLVLDTPDERLVVRARLLGSVEEARGFRANVAIVAVKAASLSDVVAVVGNALDEDGVAIPLLNGVDSERVLADAIGAQHVIGGIAQIASAIAEPGVIDVRLSGRMVLAPLRADQMERVDRLARVFSKAGFVCSAKPDLKRVLWNKLLWNGPFNAVCALARLPAGEVLDVPELEAMVRQAMHEVSSVAATEGVTIDADTIDRTIEVTRAKLRGSRPSMLQDVLAGRPTETRELQGAVVTRAAAHGIEAPVHETLLALMLGLEQGVGVKL